MSKQYQNYLAQNGFDLSDLIPNYSLREEAQRDNCLKIVQMYKEYIIDYQQKIYDNYFKIRDPMIVFISVDDENGNHLANILMPNYDWQAIRDEGAKPFVRGVLNKHFIAKQIANIDKRKAVYINRSQRLQILVVDSGIIEVFNL